MHESRASTVTVLHCCMTVTLTNVIYFSKILQNTGTKFLDSTVSGATVPPISHIRTSAFWLLLTKLKV